jgi:hypothetical protein
LLSVTACCATWSSFAARWSLGVGYKELGELIRLLGERLPGALPDGGIGIAVEHLSE